MTDYLSQQEALRKAWLSGRSGNLCPQQEAKAWALREAWREIKPEKNYGMLEFVASRVCKVGVDNPVGGGPPSTAAVSKFFVRVDADPDWFPGKSYQERHGPLPIVRGAKKLAVARSAMAMSQRGEEVTYPALVARNKKALMNPATGRPVDKSIVYAILRECCYDDADDPTDTWTHQTRASKVALTDELITARLSWAEAMVARNHSEHWFFTRVVWVDLCNSVLPRTEARHNKMVLARKGKKYWGSKKTKKKSQYMAGDKGALKQASGDSLKVWWVPILSSGKLHIEVLGSGWKGETSELAAVMVKKVRAAINIRFPGEHKPNVLFTDRGPGFYATQNNCNITAKYKAALAEHSLKAYYPDNATEQSGNLGDFYPHETAVSWIRRKEPQTRSKEPWTETVEEFTARLRGICQQINDSHDVEGLCKREPKKRLQELVDAEGDRINH